MNARSISQCHKRKSLSENFQNNNVDICSLIELWLGEKHPPAFLNEKNLVYSHIHRKNFMGGGLVIQY